MSDRSDSRCFMSVSGLYSQMSALLVWYLPQVEFRQYMSGFTERCSVTRTWQEWPLRCHNVTTGAGWHHHQPLVGLPFGWRGAYSWRRLLYKEDPFYYHGLIVISAWMNNHTPSKKWVEINHLFPNFNGCTVEIWEWIINFIPHFVMAVITYPSSIESELC